MRAAWQGGSWPSRSDGELCLGYWVAREHWGRGLATRAVRAFLDELPARPLHATVATDNVASRRVLEKCGFTNLGTTTEWDDRLGEDVAIHSFELR